MGVGSKPEWSFNCSACYERGTVRKLAAPKKCAACGAKGEAFCVEQILSDAERRVNRHKEYVEKYGPKCGAVGDFGHTNVWGSPYLMFNTYCSLPVGHAGKHSCLMDIRVAPSYEPAGHAVEPKSHEVTGETRISWALRPDAQEKVRWKNLVDVVGMVGRFAREDLEADARLAARAAQK